MGWDTLFPGHGFGSSHALSLSAHEGLLPQHGKGSTSWGQTDRPSMLSMTATCMYALMSPISPVYIHMTKLSLAAWQGSHLLALAFTMSNIMKSAFEESMCTVTQA